MTLGTKCTECGRTDYHDDYMGETGVLVKELNICHECAFWYMAINKPAEPRFPKVVIDGILWRPDLEISEKPAFGTTRWLGLGGAKQVIKLNTGQVITTYSCWCNGTIPDRFRKDLPNNAVFLERG